MTNTVVVTAASGSTDTFAIPFPIAFGRQYVEVRQDGVVQVVGVDFNWVNDGSIQFTGGNVTAGAKILRRRVTPTAPVVSFVEGSLSASDLNSGDLQSRYLAEEALDQANYFAQLTEDINLVDVLEEISEKVIEVEDDRAEVAANTATVAADKDTVAADKGTVAADKSIVAGYRTDVQGYLSTATSAADTAVGAVAAAQAARDAALAAFAAFEDVYLGEFSTGPLTDIDGSPLEPGDLYFDSVDGVMKVWTGSVWTAAYVSGTGVALLTNNGSDYNALAFRTNLDLYSTGQVDTLLSAKANANNFVGTGTFQVAAGAIARSALTNGVALSVIGRSANSGGAVNDIAAGTDGHVLRRSGTTLGFGTILSAAISDLATTISNAIAAAVGVTVQAYDAQLSSLVRQNSQSAAYGLVLTDGGKHILHPAADNNARAFTIPANASVAYPIGTVITFVNKINTLTIAITSDTLTLAGTGATGSRTLSANGIATALKISATEWLISGTGLS